MTISEKISRAIDKLYRAQFYTRNLQHYKTVVVVGVYTFKELQSEADSLMVYNFPFPRYTFRGCEVIVDFRPANCNQVTVELMDELTGEIKKRIKIQA